MTKFNRYTFSSLRWCEHKEMLSKVGEREPTDLSLSWAKFTKLGYVGSDCSL